MKNAFFCILVLSMFNYSCQRQTSMVDDMNESFADTSQFTCKTKGFEKIGRNLVYLLEPTCSRCIVDYEKFLESLNKGNCNYDSLFTIVLNGNYLMNVEYYLVRDSIYRPETERYIIDNEGTLTDYYYSISNNNSILLFDGGRLIFSTSVHAYRYEQGIGLVRDAE